MFDTNITIVGNVLTAPEWRRTANTGTLVAHFRVASTARRLDRETGQWIDGNSLRVRVNCWRRLAEGVTASIAVGDPVVVTGRLYTRDWTDPDGNPRLTYELEAAAVGHDLTRGRSRFARTRPTPTSAVDDPIADDHVRGEPTEPVAHDDAPVAFGDGLLPADDLGFTELPPLPPSVPDPLAEVRGSSFDEDLSGTPDAPEPAGVAAVESRPRRSRGRTPVPA